MIHWDKLSSDVWQPELVDRARDLSDEIVELLGPQAQAKPEGATIDALFVATQYLELSQRYTNAPSRKKLHEQLEFLRCSAIKIADLLKDSNPYLLAALSLHGFSQDDVMPLIWGQPSPLLNSIQHLCVTAQAAKLNLSLTGPSSGQKASTMPPKRSLALRCIEIFERYRPGEASTTTGGHFRTFVSRVYEIATGEQDADLEKAVKEAVKLVKKRGLPAHPNPFAEALYPHLKFAGELKALRRT